MERKVKQIIVWRGDIKVRKGKFGAQIAHASLALILNQMKKVYNTHFGYNMVLDVHIGDYLDLWLSGKFTKIVAQCKDEAELFQIYNDAKRAGLPVVLITDAGLTEFKGVPTNTCIGIGPYWAEEIDKFTGELQLM